MNDYVSWSWFKMVISQLEAFPLWLKISFVLYVILKAKSLDCVKLNGTINVLSFYLSKYIKKWRPTSFLTHIENIFGKRVLSF